MEQKKRGRKKGTKNVSTGPRKKVFLEYLEKSFGNYTVACKGSGISANTIQKWKRDDNSFKILCDKVCEDGVDTRVEIAEQKLLEAVVRGDKWAVAFILKTLGKKKGYTEKTETEHTLINNDIKFTFGMDEEKKEEDDDNTK